MPSREVLIREVILTDNLTIEPPMDRDTRRVITDIIDGKDERLEYGMRELSITATRAETTMSADAWYTLIAASRCVLLELERAGKPIPDSTLTATLGERGFTPEHVRDGVNLLRTEKVVARREGAVHDLTGTEHRAKRRLSPASLAPRNSAASAPASTGTTTAPSTNRPNFAVGNLIEHPDQQLDMGARQRHMAEASVSSYDPGDLPDMSLNPPVKKPAPVAIPDSAITALLTAVLDAFARTGKVTATWGELGVKRVELGVLPEGTTPEKVLQHVIDSMHKRGELTIAGTGDAKTFTYVPAEKAVAEVVEWLTRFIGHLSDDTYTRSEFRRDASGEANRCAPDGWSPATITDLALTKLVANGTLTVDGDTFTRVVKPEPKPEPVAPAAAPKPDETPKPSGTDPKPETPKPEDSGQVASAIGQSAADTETPAKPAKTKDAEKPAPVNAGALEKRLDTLTTEVRAIGKRLHTLPAPPTKEQVMLTDADPLARRVLETVLVQLKLKKRLAEAEEGKGEPHFAMTRDDLKSRVPGRARVTATNPTPPDLRQYLDAALEVGRAMGVIECTDTRRGGSYIFISHVNVMPKGELDRRVQRVLDIRAARAEKSEDAA